MNSTFSYGVSAYDVDGDDLTYYGSIDGNGTLYFDNNYLTIVLDQNYTGPIEVEILVSDGVLTDQIQFNILVIESLLGDLNGDEELNIVDIVLLVNLILDNQLTHLFYYIL